MIDLSFKVSGFSDADSLRLTVDELYNAKLYWIFKFQRAFFSKEIRSLEDPARKSNVKLPEPLLKLNPIVVNGFLRVGGRIDQALLPYDHRHPFILPGDCFLALLIIRQAHVMTLHGGVQLTLATTRQEVWLLNGRRAVKRAMKGCKGCVLFAGRSTSQLMGDLPSFRLSPTPPFSRSGVDYAGPFPIRLTKSRGKGTMKGYICLFVCLVTRGIHLELAEDYSSEAFIAAFHRFTSRWGHCSELVSDNGPNFVGADPELRSMFNESSEFYSVTCPYLTLEGTKWLWNPPGAPHFGGIWEAGC